MSCVYSFVDKVSELTMLVLVLQMLSVNIACVNIYVLDMSLNTVRNMVDEQISLI